MEVFEWEQRQSTTSVETHMIAGISAGISEHLLMLPIDNVKTHCQVGKRMPILSIMKKIYTSGGLTNFYSGSSVVASGCIPAHAIFFSVYEGSMNYFKCNPETDVLKFAMVGAMSSMFHDLIMTPTETLKQRMQLLRSQNSKISMKEVATKIYKTEGLLAYYRSFPINYAMNLPFGSLIIILNEKLKYFFDIKEGDNSLKYYLCGAIAGGLSSIPTTPVDVIKTKLNTQDCVNQKCYNKKMCAMLLAKPQKITQNINESSLKKGLKMLLWQNRNQISTFEPRDIKYRNIFDTTSTILKQDGIRGFFKGLPLRVVMQSVSSGISWGTYQLVKTFLVQKSITH